jgi:predicted transglutaminase-like cysteine proteinase
MHLGKKVKPFSGAVAFCKELPSRCKPQLQARMHLDAGRMAELVFINNMVNNEITLRQEPVGIDIWQDRGFTVGDCEDFALRKRLELIERGWPPGSLRIAIVRQKEADRELHAILVASTDVNDFVLDIRVQPGQDRVRAWDSKEFYELSMVWGADAKWYALTDGPPVVTVGAGK